MHRVDFSTQCTEQMFSNVIFVISGLSRSTALSRGLLGFDDTCVSCPSKVVFCSSAKTEMCQTPTHRGASTCGKETYQSKYSVSEKNFRTEVFSGSNHLAEAMPRIKEVDMVDDLKTSRSTSRRQYPHFETLHARIATALKKITQKSNFKKKVHF